VGISGLNKSREMVEGERGRRYVLPSRVEGALKPIADQRVCQESESFGQGLWVPERDFGGREVDKTLWPKMKLGREGRSSGQTLCALPKESRREYVGTLLAPGNAFKIRNAIIELAPTRITGLLKAKDTL
jgi:hypothetical protein